MRVTAWIDKRIEHLGLVVANRLLESLTETLNEATSIFPGIGPPSPPPDEPGTPKLKAVD